MEIEEEKIEEFDVYNYFDMIGRFEVKKHLGDGSFASVLLARDSLTQNFVAVKVFNPKKLQDKYLN